MYAKGSGILEGERLERQEKRLAYLLCTLTIRFQFVLRVLNMMRRVAVQDCQYAMGVRVLSNGFELKWSPWHVEQMTDGEVVFCLYHEILHILLHHCTSRKMGCDEATNIAQDVAINEIVPVSGDSCCYPVDDKGQIDIWLATLLGKALKLTGVKRQGTAEYYYELIPHDKRGGVGGDKDPASLDDHSEWQESELAADKVRSVVREFTLTNMWGSCPGDLKELIEAAQIKKLCFGQFVRTWYGNVEWDEPESTRLRPNRRMLNMGMGYDFPGTTRQWRDKNLIVIDTSASITPDIGGQFVSVHNQLIEDYPIDLLMNDAEVHGKPMPSEKRLKVLEFTGRGGTDFSAVVELIDKLHYHSVMFLTDGAMLAPPMPKHCKVLWVMPEGCKAPVDWGDRIYIQRKI